MDRTSRRVRTVGTGASSPLSGKRTKGKPKNAAGSPFAKVNSPEGKSKWNTSLANDGAECSPIKKSPSPSKTATPSSEGTKRPSLPRQQEECALPRVDENKATIKVKSDNCELRVDVKIILI